MREGSCRAMEGAAGARPPEARGVLFRQARSKEKVGPPNRGGCCVVRVGSGPRRPGRSRSEATRSFPGSRFPAKAIPRRSVSACSGMGKALPVPLNRHGPFRGWEWAGVRGTKNAVIAGSAPPPPGREWCPGERRGVSKSLTQISPAGLRLFERAGGARGRTAGEAPPPTRDGARDQSLQQLKAPQPGSIFVNRPLPAAHT